MGDFGETERAGGGSRSSTVAYKELLSVSGRLSYDVSENTYPAILFCPF